MPAMIIHLRHLTFVAKYLLDGIAYLPMLLAEGLCIVAKFQKARFIIQGYFRFDDILEDVQMSLGCDLIQGIIVLRTESGMEYLPEQSTTRRGRVQGILILRVGSIKLRGACVGQ